VGGKDAAEIAELPQSCCAAGKGLLVSADVSHGPSRKDLFSPDDPDLSCGHPFPLPQARNIV